MERQLSGLSSRIWRAAASKVFDRKLFQVLEMVIPASVAAVVSIQVSCLI
jgi:hypothetical protein